MLRPTLTAAALAALATLTAHAGAARAECAAPRPFVAAPDDGVVPPNPVLYLFAPTGMALEKVRVEGRGQAPLGVERAAAPGTESWRAWRLHLTAARPGEVVVVATFRGWGDREIEARQALTIAPPPSTAPDDTPSKATVVDYGVSQYAWPCSHENIRELGVDRAAPAYRVELLAGAEVVRAAVFPHSTNRFYRHGKGLPVVLGLGDVNCLGTTFSWRGLGGEARLRVTALLPDGAEIASDIVRVPAP